MDGASIVELVAGSELFETFGPEEIEEVATAARARSLRRNEPVFNASDIAEDLYVVRRGRIVISIASPDGRESVMALMEPGDLFGEMGLFVADSARVASARAVEPSELVSIPYPPVQRLLEARPQLLWGVVRLLSRRLAATDAALADSVFLDVTGRTAKRLLELAGDNDEFTLPVTQEELAGMVGASRERVNKALAQFSRLGWLEQADRRYRITDREQLARRAM
ncbi:MAG TPA: Crp/Fnr family transcriptional regulator [Acidimicrobiales bacterium]|nr:Crp/Fnr family transcriptional regulator [Acidimicrobiales bacterium]